MVPVFIFILKSLSETAPKTAAPKTGWNKSKLHRLKIPLPVPPDTGSDYVSFGISELVPIHVKIRIFFVSRFRTNRILFVIISGWNRAPFCDVLCSLVWSLQEVGSSLGGAGC